MKSFADMIPWRVSRGAIEIRFLGREASPDPRQALMAEGARDLELATLDQLHSSSVISAAPGLCGRGDALWTTTPGLALSVRTADCVPLVIADEHRLAVVHAGWRGIVNGIVAETVAALGPPFGLSAWIGPAIGPCCYEVGEQVATALAEVSSPEVLLPATLPGRPRRADLTRAVEIQLRRCGVSDSRSLQLCTRCRQAELWSYRRDGEAAGRNLTLAWLTTVIGGDADCV